jgi:hypothetical protein
VLHYTRQERIARDEDSSFVRPSVSYEENEMLSTQRLDAYSQHCIFFLTLTYPWVQKDRVFVSGDSFQPIVMLHSSLLGTIISYKEDKVF